MMLFCSSMMTGNHDATQLPVVLLGGGGGGRSRRAACSTTSGKPNRKMCSLYLSMMDKCGVRLKEFGDSNERLGDV